MGCSKSMLTILLDLDFHFHLFGKVWDSQDILSCWKQMLSVNRIGISSSSSPCEQHPKKWFNQILQHIQINFTIYITLEKQCGNDFNYQNPCQHIQFFSNRLSETFSFSVMLFRCRVDNCNQTKNYLIDIQNDLSLKIRVVACALNSRSKNKNNVNFIVCCVNHRDASRIVVVNFAQSPFHKQMVSEISISSLTIILSTNTKTCTS